MAVKSAMARDTLSEGEFAAVMERGLADAKEGRSRPAEDVFTALRKEVRK